LREIEVVHPLVVQFPRNQVWGFLWDIHGIAACIPGCEKAEAKDVTRQIQVIERTAPASIILIISGRDLRLKSEFSQRVEIQIRDEHGGTFIHIHAAIRIDGLFSKLSQYLIEMQIKQLLNDFSDNFVLELGRRNATSPPHDEYSPAQ
jgi:carbon monoxide dehydrogenase subunit G